MEQKVLFYKLNIKSSVKAPDIGANSSYTVLFFCVWKRAMQQTVEIKPDQAKRIYF